MITDKEFDALDPRLLFEPDDAEAERARIDRLYSRAWCVLKGSRAMVLDDLAYNVKTVARILDCSVRTVHRMIAAGEMRTCPLPGRPLRVSGREIKRIVHGKVST